MDRFGNVAGGAAHFDGHDPFGDQLARADADDVVQDAYLRWHETTKNDIESPIGFLITVTTRLCLDRLRHLKREREEYTDSWLPETVAEGRALGRATALDRLLARYLEGAVYSTPARMARLFGLRATETHQAMARLAKAGKVRVDVEVVDLPGRFCRWFGAACVSRMPRSRPARTRTPRPLRPADPPDPASSAYLDRVVQYGYSLWRGAGEGVRS